MVIQLHVLILEDRPADAELMALELRHAGFEPDWQRVETERDFLAHLDPAPDLILADYSLPQFDGMRALALVQARGLDIPFILVSGSIGEDLAVSAIQQGAADYLMKDRLTRLGPAVARALEEKRLREERRRVENELRTSQARLANILANAAEAIITTDEHQQVTFFNRAAEEIFGYAAGEVLGQPLDLLLPSRFAQNHQEYVASFVASKETARKISGRHAVRGRRKDGTEFPAEVGISKSIEDNRLIMTAILTDITERDRAEAALTTSEAQLSNALIVARMGHWEYDVAGDLFKFNDQFYAMLHTTAEQVGGYSMSSAEYSRRFVHPDDIDLVAREIQSAIESTTPNFSRQLEHRVIHGDGDVGYISVRYFVVKDSNGITVKTHGVNQDITERKRAEEALAHERNLLRTLIDSLPDTIYAKDVDSRFILINVADANQMGASSPASMIGKTDFDYFPAELVAKYRADDQTVIQSGQPIVNREEPTVDTAGNARWVLTTKIPLRDSQGEVIGLVGIGHDITERKRAEAELSFRNLLLSTQQEASIDGILVVDENGRILSYNRRFVEMWGIPSMLVEAGLDQPTLEFVTSQLVNPHAFLLRVQDLYEHRQEKSQDEVSLVDGRVFDRYSAPMLGSDEHYFGRVWYFRDITARKRAQEAEIEQRVLAEALLDTAKAINGTLDLNEVLDRILENASRVVSHDRSDIMLVEGDNVRVVRSKGYGDGDPGEWIDGMLLPISSVGSIRTAIMTGKTHFVNDTEKFPGWRQSNQTAWILSHVSAPILIKGSVIGVLNLDDKTPGFFKEADGRKIQALADQAAIAIENARLFAETTRRAEEFAALFETSRAIGTEQEISPLLQTIVDRAVVLLRAVSGSIDLYDPARQDLEIVVAQGVELSIGKRFQLGEGLAGRAAQYRQPIIVEDYQTWEHRSSSYTHIPFRAILELPMLHHGDLIGVLAVHELGESTRKFTEEDARLLSLFASQAAIAIENARLFTETKRRGEEFAALYQTSRDLGTEQEISQLLQTIVDRAVVLIHSASGSIFLYDAQRQALEIVVTNGIELPVGTRFKLGEGMAGRVARTREPLTVDDYRTWEQRSPQMASIPVTASIAVPMVFGGELVGVLVVNEVGDNPRHFTDGDSRLLSLFAGQAAIAVHDTRLLKETSTRAQQLGLLYDAGLALNTVLEPHAQLEFLFKTATKALRADRAEFFRHDARQRTLIFELGIGHSKEADDRLRGVIIPTEQARGITGWVFQNRVPLNVPDVSAEPRYITFDPDIRSGLWVPVMREQQILGVLGVLSARLNAFTEQDELMLVLFANQAAVALENARLFEEARRRLAELEAINRVSTALREAQTIDQMLPRLLDETLSVLGTTAGTIWLVTPAEEHGIKEISRGWFQQVGEYPQEGDEGLAFHVLNTGQPYFTSNLKTDPLVRDSVRPAIPEHWSGACIPIRASNETVGVLFVCVPAPRLLNDNELHLVMTLAEIAGNTIQRMRLHEQAEGQLRRLAALHTIDETITASLDLKFSLDIILEQIISELAVDAADVLLFSPQSQTFDYAAGRGFRTESLKHTHLRLGGGLAGRAALERRNIIIQDLAADADGLMRSKTLPGERFVFYCGAPLLAKGRVSGVLEIFHRASFNPNEEWLGFLEALSTQLAIAIDSAQLFADLQRSHIELGLAYDTTLEGWSRALDLRDKETEGHTIRVTEMTLRLARALGRSEDELVHIRRGALLHDIGKMGIPDSILLKPGPLTDEEWKVMRLHPVHANELLSPISYLRPALDIPFCHHEKWDGTGYPRGLKGDQIPVGARIFAVVDVWDALRSDRAYRGAWHDEQVSKYLLEQTGMHFDPKIVPVFLELIANENEDGSLVPSDGPTSRPE